MQAKATPQKALTFGNGPNLLADSGNGVARGDSVSLMGDAVSVAKQKKEPASAYMEIEARSASSGSSYSMSVQPATAQAAKAFGLLPSLDAVQSRSLSPPLVGASVEKAGRQVKRKHDGITPGDSAE